MDLYNLVVDYKILVAIPDQFNVAFMKHIEYGFYIILREKWKLIIENLDNSID